MKMYKDLHILPTVSTFDIVERLDFLELFKKNIPMLFENGDCECLCPTTRLSVCRAIS